MRFSSPLPSRFPLAFLLLLLLFPFATALGQSTIKGRVSSAQTGEGLPGAALLLQWEGADRQIRSRTALADSSGYFSFSGQLSEKDAPEVQPALPPGRYTLTVHFLGYATWYLSELLLTNARDVVLEIALEELPRTLGEVEVRAQRSALQSAEMPGARMMTVEQTQRFAATFFDPARLAAFYPGVVTANDQGNALSVRGNSPNGMLWRLEGLDIVNPNHLSNTGTAADRPTASGGGVNILSAQMLDNSTFLNGAFPAGYGNALSGVMDMRLRKGQPERLFTIQAGLIGIDVAAEGPFREGGQSTFLANYRYSAVGLLAAAGLDFGGETIAFQDLSFHLSFPGKNGGQFTVFGMGGRSRNLFASPADTARWESGKDRYNIRFASEMGALGFSYARRIAPRLMWRAAGALSAAGHERTADLFLSGLARMQNRPLRLETDQIAEQRHSLTTSAEWKPSARAEAVAGVMVSRTGGQAEARYLTPEKEVRSAVSGMADAWLWQAYATARWWPAPKWQLRAGLHATHFSLGEKARAIEPRAGIGWWPASGHSFHLSYGLHSQPQQMTTYFSAVSLPGGGFAYPNRMLGLTRAHHSSLAWHYEPTPDWQLRTELYRQHLFRVPVSLSRPAVSALNLIENLLTDSLANSGTGRNTGLEVSAEKRFSRRYFLLLSGAFYEAIYIGVDGVKRNTRFNGRYAFNMAWGREWRLKGTKDRVLIYSLRAVYLGGFRQLPIDLPASQQAQATIWQDGAGFVLPGEDYYKADLRIALRKNKTRWTRTLALDIQNLTNRRNFAFRYYDALADQVLVQHQLGIIPVLSWKVEF